MKILVFIKQVGDVEARIVLREDKKWINLNEVPMKINENDQFAIEEALRIKEKHGGEVTVATIGGNKATDALRKALALGADKAIHVEDNEWYIRDSYALAKSMEQVVNRIEPDIIVTGSQSSDLGWGTTATILASLLDIPHAWLVIGLQIENGKAFIDREMEAGMIEKSEISLPAVIEVQAGINTPRYASLRGIMQAKKKPIEKISVTIPDNRVEILKIFEPKTTTQVEFLEGDPETVAKTLIEKLRKEERVIE